MNDYIGKVSCVEGHEDMILFITKDQTFELSIPPKLKTFVMSQIGGNLVVRGETVSDPSRYLVILFVKMVGFQ